MKITIINNRWCKLSKSLPKCCALILRNISASHFHFKVDSPLHQFRPRGRSELIRACAIKNRNVFYFQGVSASTKACGKSYACVFLRMLLQVRSARAGETGVMENHLNVASLTRARGKMR